MVPFRGPAVGEAPAVAGIVETTAIDACPVEEIGLGIVRVFVGVENVDDAESAQRQHNAIRRLRAGEHILVGFHLFGCAAKIDGLPDEIALHPRVGLLQSELVGLGTGKSGRAVRIRETVALIDLGVDPQFGALPQPQAGKERDIHGLSALSAAGQAVAARIGRPHRGVALLDEGGLGVKVDVVRIRLCRRCRILFRGCAIGTEPIVQAHAQLLLRKIGIKPLPTRGNVTLL